ncbi:MAG: tRNA pseudouridine(38-40) synthase TruA [Holophagae bacterium]|jgi:tRNA pseudouridine38-40 synthase
MACRTKLTIAYLGRSFSGWQRQPAARTVQGEIERAVMELTGGRRLAVIGAGRTDAGVHAAGQVAHVDLPVAIPTSIVPKILNARLAPDVRVRSAIAVGDTFHARTSAVGKHYAYRLRWPPSALPWRDMRAFFDRLPRRPEVVEAACRLLPGRRDWSSFTVPDAARRGAVRTVFRIDCRWRSNGLDLDVFGDGFVRYQVRRMVGALLAVGAGALSIADLSQLIESPSPGAPLPTAPARGLTLERVYYRRTENLVSPEGPAAPRRP